MINNRQGGRRRGRGGGGRPQGGGGPNIGNRQDNRQRGNAAQLLEKYRGLARDAQMAGDRVQSEYYLQFADHYFRVLNENRARFEEHRRNRDEEFGDEDEGDEDMALAGDDGAEDEAAEADERPQRHQRRERFERGDRPERQPRADRHERRDRPERGERPDGEPRGEVVELPVDADASGEARQRRGRRRRPEGETEQGEERIALESLPPAIGALADDGAQEDAPKAPRRRTRRPRGEEEIAPAA